MKPEDLREPYCRDCIHARHLKGGYTRCAHRLCTTAQIPLVHGKFKGNSARERLDVEPRDANYWLTPADKPDEAGLGRMKRDLKKDVYYIYEDSGILESWRWPWKFLDTLMESCGGREFVQDDE